MNWDEHYKLWKEAQARPGPDAHLQMQKARKRVAQNSQDDWNPLKNMLSHNDKKWFVAEVLNSNQYQRDFFTQCWLQEFLRKIRVSTAIL